MSEKSNMFNQKNNNKKSEVVSIYKSGICVIECEVGYAHSKGWSRNKPENLDEIVSTIPLSEALKTMKWDASNSLFKCVINYYQEIASKVQISIRQDLDKVDLNDIYSKLGLGYCLTFLTEYYRICSNVKDIKNFFISAFTSYRLCLKFYKENYQYDLDTNKYLEPFSILMDILEVNKKEARGINEYELYGGDINDYNHIILCYDIIQDDFVLQTFKATSGYVWGSTYPLEFADNYYFPLAFISIKNMWKIFSKGNHKLMDCVLDILKEIYFLAGHDYSKPMFYICDSTTIGDVEEAEGLTSDEKALLIILKKTLNEIQCDYRKGIKEDASKYSDFVDILEEIFTTINYKDGCLKTQKKELDNLVEPLLNRNKK